MDDTERIARATGVRPSRLEPVVGHGAPSHRRWRVLFDDRPPAFAKVAAFDYVAEWLRLEHANYEALDGTPYLPDLIGWHDDGEAPVLVIEDLSEATWPPPWSDAAIEAVLSALAEVQGTPAPPEIGEDFGALFDIEEGWDPMRADPSRALSLGVFGQTWFERYADRLAEVAATAELGGDALLHGDVRSDNLCLRDGRALLIDWNWACVGAPELDLAAWLPSLRHEGGPEPWSLLPNAGPLAALLAGFFLEHATREPIPQAPHVRALQFDQGVVALRWACRELDIPLSASDCTCNTLLQSHAWPWLPPTTRTCSTCSAAKAYA
jgi:phosphotransferase family enzyme